jgi:hypothetical protein
MTDVHHHTQLLFVEMGSWELFASLALNLDVPDFCLQSGWDTGVSYQAWPLSYFNLFIYLTIKFLFGFKFFFRSYVGALFCQPGLHSEVMSQENK